MSSEKQLKESILRDLKRFEQGDLVESAIALFQTLGYGTDKRVSLDEPTAAGFLESFNSDGILKPEKALIDEWQSVDLLFQLTKDEIGGSDQLGIQFDDVKVDNAIIESYLFFGIRLSGESYSRSKLAEITREVNKLFLMPVMLVFQHGKTVTLSVINRRLSKRDRSIDVLEKVTLIKDIAVANPHRAHVEILADLSLEQLYKTHKVSNFVELHRSWQKTLDSSELNKRFFKEVSNWYFWATQQVTFPDGAEKNQAVRNATSVIRLITRLIFVWFLKEKGLVSDRLFDRAQLSQLIDLEKVESSTYYKAILQNLFFATLNQEMNTNAKPENRKFRHQGKTRDQHYMVHNVYRYRELFKQPDAALALFETVPFLNGGLFECLDRTDKENPKQLSRIDGFSDRNDNPLSVPNFLFFCDEQKVDLNPIYGTKNKRYDVRGLIDIFNSYKFTITENTPIEEEIALDPELLGKVFENLLAAYNPETEATARKQTGSFYTPREVVDYMVDESLMVYLMTKMPSPPTPRPWGEGSQSPVPFLPGEKGLGDEGNLSQRLRHLFAYNTESHQFTESEVAGLINAIDTLKVLDPAVGSGAFPMGILQKLVFILRKLDPNNERWKQQQREREIKPVLDDIQHAKRINYDAAREEAIRQLEEQLQKIETDFTINEMDYPRKLFLIENCIYGVDIQPVAVQISKLRFFISLIVEQTVNDDALNRGILPLPNLETKFIAANTLMGIERPAQLLLRNLDIEEREKQLKDVRHEFFKARTPATKQKYRDLDRDLRLEISGLLKTDGWSDKTADLLAKWEPYNQNASAEFFDPEWMFGVSDGFDVAISNPPYIRMQELKQSIPDKIEGFKKRYISARKGNYDLYVVFVERGLELLNKQGNLAFILPHKFFNAQYGEGIRSLISKGKHLRRIVHFGDQQVFTSATTYVCLLFLNKLQCKQFQFTKVENVLNWYSSDSSVETLFQNEELTSSEWNFSIGLESKISQKLEGIPLKLKDVAQIFVGTQTSADDVFVLEECRFDSEHVTGWSKSLQQEVTIESGCVKPFLRGKQIRRYEQLQTDSYLVCPYEISEDISKLISESNFSSMFPLAMDYLKRNQDKLATREKGKFAGNNWYGFGYPKSMTLFQKEKIVVPDYNNVASFTLDREGNFYKTGYGIITTDSSVSSLYILSLLNSRLLFWYLSLIGTSLRGGYVRFWTQFIEKLPIVTIDPLNSSDKERYEQIVELAKEILLAKRQKTRADTSPLERQIDEIVYGLYELTDEEIQVIEKM